MRIAILGEKRWSHHFIQKVLEVGYEVTLLTPRPEQITISHTLLDIHKGTAEDATAVERAAHGANIVVGLFSRYSEARIQNLLHAAQAHDIRRVILFSEHSGDIQENSKKHSIFMRSRKSPSIDMIRSSDRDWTLIYPLGQKEMPTAHVHIDVSADTLKKVEDNFAHFLVNQLTDASLVTKLVTI